MEKAERATREVQEMLAQERAAREASEQQNELLRNALQQVYNQSKALEREIQHLGNRLVDIPLVEVMSALGHQDKREGETMLCPAHGRHVALSLSDNRLFTRDGKFMGEQAVDVAMLLYKAEQRKDLTQEQVLGWLAEKFGESRALAAYVVWRESGARQHLEETRPAREERMRPARVIQRAEPGRPSQDHTRADQPRRSSSPGRSFP